jgi:vancomycin permeability regulator SanA
MVMARVVGDKVIIDEDTTDRPLWKELVAAGIPREQIILTYAGETLPENVQPS